MQFLLYESRHTKNNAGEFFRRVSKRNFGPSKRKTVLEAIQHYLKEANEGKEVPEDKLHKFLQHFYLLNYDLNDKDPSVTFSLLLSHIAQFHGHAGTLRLSGTLLSILYKDLTSMPAP